MLLLALVSWERGLMLVAACVFGRAADAHDAGLVLLGVAGLVMVMMLALLCWARLLTFLEVRLMLMTRGLLCWETLAVAVRVFGSGADAHDVRFVACCLCLWKVFSYS